METNSTIHLKITNNTANICNEIVDHNLASWFDCIYLFHCTVDVNIMSYGSTVKHHYILSVLIKLKPVFVSSVILKILVRFGGE